MKRFLRSILQFTTNERREVHSIFYRYLAVNNRKILRALTWFILVPLFAFPKEQKVGFVESTRIFTQYQATAAAEIQFNEYVNDCRDSAASLQRSIENLKGELEAQKLVLSEEARLKKLDEIDVLSNQYNLYLQEVFGPGGKVEQKNDELMSPLLKKINDAVAKIAEQEGFVMILDLSEGIYYASGELNVTDLVINELNREYGVTTLPTGETRPYIGILVLRQENPDAVSQQLGVKCQHELYNALYAFSQTIRVIGEAEVKSEYVKRNWNPNIDDAQAIQIGSFLQCDYIVTGKVTKVSTKIDYTIYLKKVKTNATVGQQTNSVTDENRLSEALISDLRALIDLLSKEKNQP